MKEKVTLIKLTSEQLRKIRGGYSMSANGNSEGRISREELIIMTRRAKLANTQDIVREAMIYQKGARGIFDVKIHGIWITWCKQSSYDVMEATGVHMEAFYGDKDRYNVSANKAYRNVEKYQDSWAMMYANIKMHDMQNYNNIGGVLKQKLYQEGLTQCPIQEISADEAQKLANQGYTVVAMWKNPNKVKDENGNWQEVSGHMATLRPDYAPYDSKAGPLVSNVGDKNSIETVNKRFYVGFKSDTVKYYYDKNQTFTPNKDYRGPAYDFTTGKQSPSIHDTDYNKIDYLAWQTRVEMEDALIDKVKDELITEEMYKQVSKQIEKEVNKIFNRQSLLNQRSNNNLDLVGQGCRVYLAGNTSYNFIKHYVQLLKNALDKGQRRFTAVLLDNESLVQKVLAGEMSVDDAIDALNKQKAAQEAALKAAAAEVKRLEEEKKKALNGAITESEADNNQSPGTGTEASQTDDDPERAHRGEYGNNDSNDTNDNEKNKLIGTPSAHETVPDPDEPNTSPPLSEEQKPVEVSDTAPADPIENKPAPPLNKKSPETAILIPAPDPGNPSNGSPDGGHTEPIEPHDPNKHYYVQSLPRSVCNASLAASSFDRSIFDNDYMNVSAITSVRVAGFPSHDIGIKEIEFKV